jgi:hypothetical protein
MLHLQPLSCVSRAELKRLFEVIKRIAIGLGCRAAALALVISGQNRRAERLASTKVAASVAIYHVLLQ